MNQPCNNCVRGLTAEKKEVCTHCAGTGILVEQPASVPSAVHDTPKEVPIKKVIAKKK